MVDREARLATLIWESATWIFETQSHHLFGSPTRNSEVLAEMWLLGSRSEHLQTQQRCQLCAVVESPRSEHFGTIVCLNRTIVETSRVLSHTSPNQMLEFKGHHPRQPTMNGTFDWRPSLLHDRSGRLCAFGDGPESPLHCAEETLHLSGFSATVAAQHVVVRMGPTVDL